MLSSFAINRTISKPYRGHWGEFALYDRLNFSLRKQGFDFLPGGEGSRADELFRHSIRACLDA